MRKDCHRIQFEYPREKMPEFDAMQKLTGEPTRASFILSAMTLLEWAMGEVLAGRKIVSRNKETGEMTQFLVPAFAELEARRKYTEKAKGGLDERDNNV